MKLHNYAMMLALNDDDYVHAGQIMAQYFSLPGIAQIAGEIKPQAQIAPAYGMHSSVVCIACNGIGYCWSNRLDFYHSSVFANDHPFRIWIRR